jgi:uncharacterized membrane protein YbhN (UPF0104 family)
LVLLLFLLAGVLYFDILIPQHVIIVGTGITVVGFGGIAVLLVIDRYVELLPLTFSTVVDYLKDSVHSLARGFSTIRTKRQISVIGILSIVLWSCDAASYYLFMRAFGIEVPVLAAFFFLSVTGMGLVMPSSAGNVGSFQYFTILGLSTFGVAKSTALGFSFFLHGMQYVVALSLGIPLLLQFSTTVSNIWSTQGASGEDLPGNVVED